MFREELYWLVKGFRMRDAFEADFAIFAVFHKSFSRWMSAKEGAIRVAT